MKASKSIAGRRAMVTICLMAFLVLGIGALSWAQGVPWRDHAAPYSFTFGNHIDTHQQSKEVRGELQGFIYISYTEDPPIDGVPVAIHCDGDTDPANCVVGWKFTGKQADTPPTFVFHDGDHPLWLVESRSDIPQPGGYSHFHWLDGPTDAGELIPGDTYPGYFLELFAIRTFYFKHGGGMIFVKPGLDIATHVNIVASFPDR